MPNLLRIILVGLIACLIIASTHAEDWPRFRGPQGRGVVDDANFPLKWSDTENVKWSISLPGPGSSSPVVVGDKVILTCYTGFGVDEENPGEAGDLKRHVLCYSRSKGDLLWQETVHSAHDEDPYGGFITQHGFASATPVVDGNQVFATFGKTGVVATDLDGNRQWLVNVGSESDPAKWGNGGSSIVYDDLVIVNAANTDHSFVALKKSDGSEVWRYKDPQLTNCWSTPIVVKVGDHDELITCVPNRIVGLDPRTGDELWTAETPITTSCASVVEHDGVVYAMGGRAGDAIGIRLGGEGDVSATHTAWKSKLRSGIGTPVVMDGKLFWTATGLAFCASCETGESIYKERLSSKAEPKVGARRMPTGDYASAIAVGENVLLTTRNGTTHVVAATGEYKEIAVNVFEKDAGPFNGTPAVSDGELFIRSNTKLYCVAKD